MNKYFVAARNYFLLFLIFGISAESAQAAFVGSQQIRKDFSPDLRLNQVDLNQDLKIVYKGFNVFAKRKTGTVEVKRVEFEFAPLTLAQFKFLQTSYGGGRNTLLYQKGRKYLLTDFLPPLLQALAQQFFVPELSSDNMLMAINCWALGLSFVRHLAGEAPDITLFYVPEIEFRQFINSSTNFENIQLPYKDSIANPAAEFGDLILHLGNAGHVKGAINHVSIYIDKDLYFEKVGPGPDMPFRLISFRAGSVSGQKDYQYLRLKKDSQLLHPSEILSSRTSCSLASGVYTVVGSLLTIDINLELNKQKKAQIPAKYQVPFWGQEVSANTCPTVL